MDSFLKSSRITKSVYLFLLFFSTLTLSAQSSFKFYDEISLPQTDAWNFIRQGDVSPSLYTGTINLSIPIYNFKDKDFNFPLVATYSSNGNTPNQLPGILGPGWNLQLGGCITLETNGIPDYGENVKHVPGFYSMHTDFYHNGFEPAKWWRFMYSLLQNGSGTGAPEILWCPGTKPTNNHQGELDTQPDIFHFTIPGHSGSFHLGFRGNVVFYNTTADPEGYKLDIETRELSSGTYGFTRFNKLTITTPDGYKYIFFGYPEYDSVDLAKSGERIGYDMITAWHLNRIESPNGRWAAFSYNSYEHTTYTPGNIRTSGGVEDTQYYFEDPIIPYYNASGKTDDNRSQERETRNAVLTNITLSDGSYISLTYNVLNSSSGDEYRQDPASSISTYSNTIRLNTISVVKAGSNSQVANASFTYARNTNGAKTNYLQSITIQGEGTYSFQYVGWNDSSKPYPHHNCFQVDHWGYFNGKEGLYYPTSQFNVNTQDEVITGQSRDADANYAIRGMIERITYPTGGYSTFEYEPHDYSVAVSRTYDTLYTKCFQPRLIEKTGTAGGLRIKKISSYLSNGTLNLEKNYTYKDALGKSSGILTWVPRYKVQFSCQATNNLKENSSYYSSSLQDYGFANVEYHYATEHLKDSTRTLNIFTSSADGKWFKDELNVAWESSEKEKALLANGQTAEWNMYPYYGQPLKSVHFAVAPVTSFQSQRGQLRESRVYKNDTTLSASWIQKTDFLIDSLAFTQLPCYLVRRFGTYPIFTGKHMPKENVSISRSDDMKDEKIVKSLLKYNRFKEVIQSTQITPEGDSVFTEYTHLRDLTDSAIQANTVFAAMKRKNILNLPLEVKTYRKAVGGNKEMISGTRCTYSIIPFTSDTLIKPTLVEVYDTESQTWKTEAKLISYDAFGNITQLEDNLENTVSYLWSSDGQYLLLQTKGLTQSQLLQYISNPSSITAANGIPDSQEAQLRNAFPNAEITTIKYTCGFGPQRIRDNTGMTTEYTYTQWGKLKETKRYKTDLTTVKAEKNTYSNDN
ncbi:MAG: hypothetical protein IKZ50_06215 [Bacteroidales bacterium]|nr:hypothetical protein [Bacteroidales bacterium]